MRPPMLFLVLAFVNFVQPQITVYLATCEPPSTSTPASGLDFRILVIAATNAIVRRQEVSANLGYLESGGQIQPSCQNSSIFRLANGLLSSGNKQISVASDVPSSRFSTSDSVQALDGIFAVATDGSLIWDNGNFDERKARFGTDSKDIVYGVYTGSMPNNFTRVTLKAMDTSECPYDPEYVISSTLPSTHPSSPMTVERTAQSQPVASDTASLTSLKGSRMPTGPTSSSPPSINTSFSPNVTYPTNSSASTSSMASGSFPASVTLTTSAYLTTSADLTIPAYLTSPANLTASTPSSTPPPLPFDARSIIVSSCWYDWCNDLLGYNASQAGGPIFVSPITATTAALDHVALLSPKDAPSDAIITTITPTLITMLSNLHIDRPTIDTEFLTTSIIPIYSHPSALPSAIQRRRISFVTPPALQSYSPDSLSSACSDLSNYSIPTTCIPARVVSTRQPTTILNISYTTAPPIIFNSTITTNLQNTTLISNTTAPTASLNSTITTIPQRTIPIIDSGTPISNTTASLVILSSTAIPTPQNVTPTPDSTTIVSDIAATPVTLSTTITELPKPPTINSTIPISSTTASPLILTSTAISTPPTPPTPTLPIPTPALPPALLLPTLPIYPPCLILLTATNSRPITIIDNSPNPALYSLTSSAYDCCVQCQTTPLCGGMYWINNVCTMILAGSGVCLPGVPVGSFEGLGGEGNGDGAYTVGNGTCGILVM